MLAGIEMVDGFRLAADLDIAAMKINAINGRGAKKDFYDIHLLLKKFSLTDMLDAYKKKFGIDNIAMSLRSLVYFEDAENTQNPNNSVQNLHKVTWDEVKRGIIAAVKQLV